MDLIENKKKLKEYYTTVASLYEFTGGQLLKTEDKEFCRKVTEVIGQNIDNAEFALSSGIRKIFFFRKVKNYLKVTIFDIYRFIHF